MTSSLQNSSDPSTTPYLPRDCALALAFPLSREEFFHSAQSEPEDGFIRTWIRRYPGYPLEQLWLDFAPVARYADCLATTASDLGVLVERGTDLACWVAALSQRRVTTLVAHWSPREGQDFIQFADGFVLSRDCAESLPNPFYGVLDMTICRSVRLIESIKSRRPQCTILANKNTASLNLRLAIYRQALRLLATGKYSFVDAMLKIHHSGLEVL